MSCDLMEAVQTSNSVLPSRIIFSEKRTFWQEEKRSERRSSEAVKNEVKMSKEVLVFGFFHEPKRAEFSVNKAGLDCSHGVTQKDSGAESRRAQTLN